MRVSDLTKDDLVHIQNILNSKYVLSQIPLLRPAVHKSNDSLTVSDELGYNYTVNNNADITIGTGSFILYTTDSSSYIFVAGFNDLYNRTDYLNDLKVRFLSNYKFNYDSDDYDNYEVLDYIDEIIHNIRTNPSQYIKSISTVKIIDQDFGINVSVDNFDKYVFNNEEPIVTMIIRVSSTKSTIKGTYDEVIGRLYNDLSTVIVSNSSRRRHT